MMKWFRIFSGFVRFVAVSVKLPISKEIKRLQSHQLLQRQYLKLWYNILKKIATIALSVRKIILKFLTTRIMNLFISWWLQKRIYCKIFYLAYNIMNLIINQGNKDCWLYLITLSLNSYWKYPKETVMFMLIWFSWEVRISMNLILISKVLPIPSVTQEKKLMLCLR